MTGRVRLVALAMLWLLAGCAAAQDPASDASGDFSVVLGVPPEWAARVDDVRYLDPADCSVLCPAAFQKRVTSCHLARVTGKSSPDTAAVVCNGGAGVSSR